MKIYILRHEDRYDQLTFDTSLTKKGLLNANNKIKYLLEKYINKENIIIYCSPFLRTIQTIYPFCKKFNLKINCENALYEFMNNDFENVFNINKKLEDIDYIKLNHPDLYEIVNKNYNTLYDLKNINLYEKEDKNIERSKNFLNNIKKNKDILLVSHESTINGMLINLLNKYDKNINFEYNYPIGGLCEIEISDQGNLISSKIFTDINNVPILL
tara:strand:+ start:2454 stop:3095 length:642 start_codon:yes stop_codon:yes gene_type:complete